MKESDMLTSEKEALKFRDRLASEQRWTDRVADVFTNYFGTIEFLFLNVVLFVFWIVANENLIPGISTFDPYPYGLLTMIVSLEAIFLATIVLITQNRTNKVATLREELDFIVTLQAEEELTRIITMLDEVHDHLGLNPKDDHQLRLMKKRTDIEQIRKMLTE